MFGKKKEPQYIDHEQLALIENAQHRVKQKKRLYTHFILFIIGSGLIVFANLILKVAKDFMPFEKPWCFPVVVLWFAILLYHLLNVFVINTFMGKAWEKKQLDKLVQKQQYRIEKIKLELEKEAPLIAKSLVYNQELAQKRNNLTMIVAAGENNEIGKDNDLIWHLRDDLKRFKALTSGHHIIMGRKTFESFPKPLPNRTHVVITRQQHYQVPEGVIVVNSIEAAIEAAKSDQQPFIIGGGEIYKQAMSFASRIELTRVHATFEADTFFPEINKNNWKEVASKVNDIDEQHKHAFTFLTYERR